ncbi:MAG: hypothetical protein NC826_03590 [Candidatus Omnitrophica bacterium]|nr:hypothetical protein [Candidatus Omnitrophota bacterium]
MVKVILPELGEGIERATISYWYYQEGQKVNKDNDLVELVTDKATFNLPAPCSGILSQIIFKEGQTVNIGEVLALIEEE